MRSLLMLLLLAGMIAGYSAAQISDYGAGQVARQAVDIRAPYLAQMAQIRLGAASSKPGTARSAARTTFKRASGWFKPWAMANEISKAIEWDPKAEFGSGFARQEAQRQALTKLFTACLDTYEEQAKAEGLATDDLAVTYAHAISLNWELGNGRRMPASDKAALRRKLQDEFCAKSVLLDRRGQTERSRDDSDHDDVGAGRPCQCRARQRSAFSSHVS
jgi:hypothetical protein